MPGKLLTLLLGIPLLLGLAGPASAQPSAFEQPPDEPTLPDLPALESELKRIGDWDAEFDRMIVALDNMFRENGWTSESDRFARDMVTDVGRIPPWDLPGRLNRMMDLLRDRYQLDDEAQAHLQGAILRETVSMTAKHAGLIIEQTREWIDCRVQGKPITPEMAAEWSREGIPLYEDGWKAVETVVKDLKPRLNPDAQKTLERDFQAAGRRHKSLMAQTEKWAAGDWKASDWGMQDDPIQLGLIDPARYEERGASEASRIPTRWLPHDPTTWIAYAVYVERKVDLSAAQASAVRSIHDEMALRAADYLRMHRAELSAVPAGVAATHESFEPVRSMFAHFRARIDGVLTEAQRVVIEG